MKFEWKSEYEDGDDIPAGAKDAYEEKDGKFVLVRPLQKTQLENSYNKTKDRLKTANDKLKKFEALDLSDEQIESIGDDLEELQELRQLKEDGELDPKNNEEIEARVAKRVENATKNLENRIVKLESDLGKRDAALDKANGRLTSMTLSDKIRNKAKELKVQDHSLRHLERDALDEFTLDESGEVVDAKDEGRSMDDWLAEQVETNPIYMIDLKNAGTGAQNAGDLGPGGKNPFSKDDWNLTEQGSLVRDNPAKAERLASMAGTKVGGPRPSA